MSERVEKQARKQDTVLWFGFRKNGQPHDINPVQQEVVDAFFKDQYKYFLLDGGVRSGKTSVAVQCAVQQMMKTPGISILFGHANLASLQSSLIAHLLDQIPKDIIWRGKKYEIVEVKQNQQKIYIRIPWLINEHKGYTAVIDYRPLDPSKGLHLGLQRSGAEYGLIVLDQVELLSEEVYQSCFTRLSGLPGKVILTANPDPDQWFFRRFGIDGGDPLPDADRYYRKQMLPYDNFALNPDFIPSLRAALPEALQARFIDGSYAQLEGLIFSDTDFNPDKNLVSVPFPIPSDWVIWEAYDHGYKDPAVCQWWGVDRNQVKTLIHSLRMYEKTYEEIAKIVCTERRRILTEGRPDGDPRPRFAGTIGDPSVGSSESEGRVPMKEIARYTHTDGSRMVIIQATAKGLPKEQQKLSRITIFLEEMRGGRVHVNQDLKEWNRERKVWVWDSNSRRTEPHDWRSKDSNGKIIHHFDNMYASLYFISHYIKNISNEKIPQAKKPHDYNIANKKNGYNPITRFDRTRVV